MHWDWKSLIKTLVPIIVSWLLGSLGIGVPQLTPDRIANTPSVTAK